MKSHPRLILAAAALMLPGQVRPIAGQDPSHATITGQSAVADAPVPPATYLGHPVGIDFRLAGWDTITGYFNRLALASPLVRLDTLGVTTRGAPFLAVTLTSAENMERLEEIRLDQAKLADPRRLAEGELQRLLERQPAVVVISHNIHSTEIASSQGVMELAYSLATDAELGPVLRDVVVILIPSVNPDGQQRVVDWYRRTVGTPYEGSGMPWLYHHYVGHDNNRDFFMLTQVESRMVNDLLYRRWFPEVVYDVHQMGNSGARFFVPPFDDPANPNIDPLLVRSISLFGLQISTDLEAAGKTGVVNGERFDLWWHGGMRTVPSRHNMIGILSEAASARLASPIFQEPGQADRQPHHGVNYPNPWPGGWWRIRDIIDYQLIASRAVIELAAAQRRRLIRNFVTLGQRAVEAGRSVPPFAYIVPHRQPDPGSAAAMLEVLREGAVEIHRATAAFVADGIEYAAGDWVVLMAQPYRAHVKDLLERQSYPDRRLYPGGPPETPYDATGWTLPLQMGVDVVEVKTPFEAALDLEVERIRPPSGRVLGSGPAFIIEPTTNGANRAINRALRDGARVALLSEPRESGGRLWPAGSAILRGDGVQASLEELAALEGLSAESFRGTATGYNLQTPRLGLYQPWTASMDEGWARWVLEGWDLPYRTVHDTEIRAGDLRSRYDVIIFPDISTSSIVEGRRPGTVPAEYEGGIGSVGTKAIRDFVRAGGTLICFDGSSGFAIEHLSVRVKDVRPPSSEQRSGEAFYAPGSLLSVTLDTSHPLAYGMPEEAAVLYSNSAIFEVPSNARGVTAVARYPEMGQLLSGYAINSEFLSGKAALVDAKVGDGRVVLFGFRPQHRGQTHETFKLLFNAVYRGIASGPSALEY